MSEENARFVAESREALPYWLQRVKELEADLAFLMREYGDSEEPMTQDALQLKERCNILKERDELRERVKKLEAVVEAAKGFLNNCQPLWCRYELDYSCKEAGECWFKRLVQALEKEE